MTSISKNYVIVSVLFVIIILISGLRFSDGSMLLAISSGADVSHPVFAENPDAQYIFDSPLKVQILKLIPSSIVLIAVLFLILSLAPIFLLFMPHLSSTQRINICYFLLLTPALTIGLQNIGMGDGLVITLTLLACLLPSPIVAGLLVLLMGLWHPQQSFFIVVTMLFMDVIQNSSLSKKSIFICIGAAVSMIIYFAFLSYLSLPHQGRDDYMISNFNSIFSKNVRDLNIFAIPVISVICFCGSFFAGISKNKSVLIFIYLLFLVLVSSATTDFSRVFFLISAPIIFRMIEGSEKSIFSNGFVSCYAIVLFSPMVSWSGLDFLLYGDLLGDMCKWGVYCF